MVTPTAAIAAQTASFCGPGWAGWSDIDSNQSSCSLSVFIFLFFLFTCRDQNSSDWRRPGSINTSVTHHMGCGFTGFDGGKNNSSSRLCDGRLCALASLRSDACLLRLSPWFYLATSRWKACRNSLLPCCPLITCRSFPVLSKSSSVTCFAPCLLAKRRPLSVRISAMT